MEKSPHLLFHSSQIPTFAIRKKSARHERNVTPVQQHLLKLFSFDSSEAYARKIQEVLTHYFQEKLNREADRLWDEGLLDQKRLDELRTEDLHKNP